MGDHHFGFKVINGLRQGCVLAPRLFILFFSFVLRNVDESMPEFGAEIKHKLDGRPFSLQRLRAKLTPTTKLDNFLYADDAALVTTSPESLHEGVGALKSACDI